MTTMTIDEKRKRVIRRARAEKRRRTAARSSLLDYAQYVYPGYMIGNHHRLLAEKLDRVRTGELRRLMVFMPPRHGKSLLVSVLFPTFLFGLGQSTDVVQAAYSESQALRQSKLAREICRGERFNRLFPDAVMQRGETAKQDWSVSGSNYYAVGVGGSLTGRGCQVAIIDDPVKDREEAESLTIRDRIWDWYRSTLYTRLTPTGAIILVMTRWNADDLAGRAMEQMHDGGEPWEVVSLPAIGNDGAALWPERWPLDELNRIRATVGQYEWSSLYLQSPYVRGGNLFNLDRVIWHDSVSDFPDVPYVRSWDPAHTEKQINKSDPDFTAGPLVGISYEADGMVPHLWIKDVVIGQWAAPRRNDMIRATAQRDGDAIPIIVESVGGGKDVVETMKAALKGLRTVKAVTVSSDKVLRAAPLEPLFEAGNVHILNGPWRDELIKQFQTFPSSGAHDDIVDGVSAGYRYLKDLGRRAQNFDARQLRVR